jgi:2-polyprenyl-3-methyl-5-hydroxy-6-metoxy-1,4-benzoquinol methylase
LEYEPVKERLRKGIQDSAALRKIFYRVLGVVFLREWYVKREIKRIFSKRQMPLTILDAGCGFGQYSYFCVRHFPHAVVVGLEIHEKHVAAGNRFVKKSGLKRLHFEAADITELSWRNRFDLILNIDVLEHVEQDRDLLRRFCVALKPEGSLILSTPTVYRRSQADCAFVGEHVRTGYSEEEIRQKMQDAGLQVKKVIYGYGMWGDLSWRWGIRNVIKCFSMGFPGKIFGVLYLVMIFPIVEILMIFDFIRTNKRGTGFIIVADKSYE